MLYTEINEFDMQQMLEEADRDNFTIEALEGYVDFVYELGENMKFDPVAFDCQFIEYKKNRESAIRLRLFSGR